MILVTKVQLIDSISAFKIIMLYEFATLIDRRSMMIDVKCLSSFSTLTREY